MLQMARIVKMSGVFGGFQRFVVPSDFVSTLLALPATHARPAEPGQTMQLACRQGTR
jgi:hypothetical protein